MLATTLIDPAGKGGTTVTMADVDGDGRLDLYVANYKAYTIDDSVPPQQRAFNQMVRQVGGGKYEIVPRFQRDYKLVMRPDMGGLRMTQRGAPDDFYHNDGQHFTRVPMTSGKFLDAQGKPLTEEPESFALGAKFVDLNGDGAPDLYVANDFEDTDQLWFNDGHGNFRLADWTSQRQMSNSTMGFDVADVNGDGLPDLFGVDMLAQRFASSEDADPDAHGVSEEARRHRDAAAAAAEHALHQSRRRDVRRGGGAGRCRGERVVVGDDVHGRRPRWLAGHSHRQRPSVGHHGRRRAGAFAEPVDRRAVAANALAVSAAAVSRTSRSAIAAT